MMNTDDYLQMSGIQHFAFCRRQWALAYLEQQWSENQRTAEGRLQHTRCHDVTLTEKRGDLLIARGMRVVSHRLKLTGDCDVVEFHKNPNGVSLQGRRGLQPMPVEYKHGRSKVNDADRLQLCAQAMALEEMLVCEVPEGEIFYEETRQREHVSLTPELRSTAQTMADEPPVCARLYPKKQTRQALQCLLTERALPAGAVSAGRPGGVSAGAY